jgi:hypothetical protein
MSPRARAVLIAVALLAWPAARQAAAYLRLGANVDGQSTTVGVAWRQMPVHYVVNDVLTVPGVSPDQLRDAIAAALATWEQVPTATVGFQYDGFSSAEPLDQDGVNAMGFRPRADMSRTLAATNYLVDSRTGELVEADIFFNSVVPWSTAPAGEPGRYDLQTVATHEAGHLLGLAHSAIGETALQADGRRLLASGSAMFPIVFAPGLTLGRRLWPDDIAGISEAYPAAGYPSSVGSIHGTVLKDGHGVHGAHVVAFSLATGAMIGAFTLDGSGQFVVAGLAEGEWLLRVEPLDDGDVSSFIDDQGVDTDFRVAFYPGIVTVRAGRDAGPVTVTVTAK